MKINNNLKIINEIVSECIKKEISINIWPRQFDTSIIIKSENEKLYLESLLPWKYEYIQDIHLTSPENLLNEIKKFTKLDK